MAIQQAKKLEAKAREEPLVVVGCILTVSALAAGLVSFLRGNSHLGNQLMQARILAQGGTVTGVVGYAAYRHHNANPEDNVHAQTYEQRKGLTDPSLKKDATK